jgi:hypothetical protein
MKIDKGTVIVIAAVLGCAALFWYLTKKAKADDVVPPAGEGGGGGVDTSGQDAEDAAAALLRAQQAAEAAAVQAAAEAAAAAAAANEAAQVAASLAAADAAKAAAAAAAQAEANRQAALFEASLAAQLSEVEAATNAAKQSCDSALTSYVNAKGDLAGQQAFVDARMSSGMIAVEIYENGGLNGKCNSWSVGDYPSFANQAVGNDHASSFYLYRGFRLIGFKDSNFLSTMQVWEALTGNLQVELNGTNIGNDNMSSCRVQPCPAAYASLIGSFQDKVTQIKINLAACKSSLNLCIERTQSVIDNIRTYNVLSSRISTVSSSLIALRTYVSQIPV